MTRRAQLQVLVKKGAVDISMDEFAKLFPEHLIRIIALVRPPPARCCRCCVDAGAAVQSKELMRALEPSYNAPDAPPLDSRIGARRSDVVDQCR